MSYELIPQIKSNKFAKLQATFYEMVICLMNSPKVCKLKEQSSKKLKNVRNNFRVENMLCELKMNTTSYKFTN